jgi:hypothetical protein
MTQLSNRDFAQMLHVRFDGRSEELTLDTLKLNSLATDVQIKEAVVTHFDLPAHYLDSYVVVRTSQAIIVRPEAIYG